MYRKIISLRKFFKSTEKLRLVLVFFIGILLGISYIELNKPKWFFSKNIDINNNVSICFTPPSGCEKLITDAIAEAQSNIFIHAFSFTSVNIANELVNAFHRGVKVALLVDESTLKNKNSQIFYLKKNKIPVYIDKVLGLAHNKIIIIDQLRVITGSFNFTKAADKRNADNIIMVRDKSLANKYIDNWYKRFQLSKLF